MINSRNSLTSMIASQGVFMQFFARFSLFAAISMLTVVGFSSTAKAATLHNEDTDGDLSDDGLNSTVLGDLALGSNSLKATFNAGSTNSGSDYFTFTVPEGLVLTDIVLQSWNTEPNFEDIAFFAVQEGTEFNYAFPNDLEEPASGLLGWSHLRSTQVGSPNKILSEMSVANLDPDASGLRAIYEREAASNPYSPEQIAQLPEDVTEAELIDKLNTLADTWGAGASGFSLPLKPGDYSFWLRQGSDINIAVELDFNTASTQTSIPESFSLVGTFATLGLGTIFIKKRC